MVLARTTEENFPGTRPEFLCFQALTRLGKIINVDYTFQSDQYGGRTERGGLVVDFFFSNPPDLAISVLGSYWHYELGGGTRGTDLITREILAAGGTTLIFIDDIDLEEDAIRVVRAALRFEDESNMARGL